MILIFKAVALLAFLAPPFVDADTIVGKPVLGAANEFAILSKTGITTTGITKIQGGPIGVFPENHDTITGFALSPTDLVVLPSTIDSTESIYVGHDDNPFRVYAADYTGTGTGLFSLGNTVSELTMAISAMEAAYTDVMGRENNGFVSTSSTMGVLKEVILKPGRHSVGQLNDVTVEPGTHRWNTNVDVTNRMYFKGGPDDIWIMQIDDTFDLATGAMMVLENGAKSENIFWAISGAATFLTTSHAEGVFLGLTTMAFQKGSSLAGGVYSHKEVTLIATAINRDGESSEVGSSGTGGSLCAEPATELQQSGDGERRPVDLGAAGNFVILTKSGIMNNGGSNTHVSHGDIGVSPIDYAAMTGFALDPVTHNADNKDATSAVLTSDYHAYAANYYGGDGTTPAMMTRAILAMEAAYTDVMGRGVTFDSNTVIWGRDGLSDTTFAPGIYKWTSTVEMGDGDITFDAGGDADAIWIMQISQTFVLASGAQMLLANGAKSENIYWAIAGTCYFMPGSHAEGIFLGATYIAFQDGSSLNGVAFAQTAVTITGGGANIIKEPHAEGRRVLTAPAIDVATITKDPFVDRRLVVTHAGPAPIDLGTACEFVILAETGVTNDVPTITQTKVSGNIGASPIESIASVTNFFLKPDPEPGANALVEHATSKIVRDGLVYHAGMKEPTHGMLTVAVGDMLAAYNEAAGRVDGGVVLNRGAAAPPSSQTYLPGIYKWTTALTLNGVTTFDGGPDDVWIMQVAGAFVSAPQSTMLLVGGAKASNIYWAVAGGCAVQDSHVKGVFLSKTTFTMTHQSSLYGAALAQTAVTLISNTIIKESTCAPDPDAIVEICTDSPTGTPTTAPVVVPTAAPVVAPTAAPTPYVCISEDVTLVATVGETAYNNLPITVTQQDMESVTFQVSNEWFGTSITSLYTEYADSRPSTTCQENHNVDEVIEITASCRELSPTSIVRIWVVDNGLTSLDNAQVPACCHETDLLADKSVQYTFIVNCEPGCIPNVARRLGGSEL